MVYSPFDFNEAIGHRKDYAEDGLREGSPVVGVSFAAGLLILTVRKSQRKVFEIYDRLIYSAIGRQSDIEDIRLGAVRVAHEEGYARSPDDVTAQRLVGFSLSPSLKRLFGDQFNAPAVIRAVFGELGRTAAEDVFYVLNYDGEFTRSAGFAAIAGSEDAEERMAAVLSEAASDAPLDAVLERALFAWGVGAREVRSRTLGGDADEAPATIDEKAAVATLLREELTTAHLEVGLLERDTPRESKFRLLTEAELSDTMRRYTTE